MVGREGLCVCVCVWEVVGVCGGEGGCVGESLFALTESVKAASRLVKGLQCSLPNSVSDKNVRHYICSWQ